MKYQKTHLWAQKTAQFYSTCFKYTTPTHKKKKKKTEEGRRKKQRLKDIGGRNEFIGS